MFGALQLALLILWVRPSAVRTRATVPTTIVSIVGSLVFCLLSYTEHAHSVQPSLILNVYLLITLLFDIVRARTLWLRHYDHYNEVIAIVFTATVALKLVLLLLEAIEKRWILQPTYKSYPPEAISGIYNKSFFWWLNSLFRKGFSTVLTVDDLFTLDKGLTAEYLQERLQRNWVKRSSPVLVHSALPASSSLCLHLVTKKRPNSLLGVAFDTLKWPLLAVVTPRACLIALNFSQPFLINRAIKLSNEPISEETTNIGYGLIGAYILVYTGIAVCLAQLTRCPSC